VFLAIGTWKEGWVYLPGTELTGVIPALPFLEGVERDEKLPVGKKVVVIGGGNAAIDSARTARRLGADVTIVYRRERNDMPAIPEEIEAAEHEGAKLLYLAAPHRIVGDNTGRVRALEAVKTKLGEFDTSGRRTPVLTDEVIRVECDTVILAVGEKVDPDFCKASGLKHQGIRHDRGRPLHAGDEPRAVLRRRRPHHRRLERVQRDGHRQEGRPKPGQAVDGRRALRESDPRLRVPDGAAPDAERVRSPCAGRDAGAPSGCSRMPR
jgi:hypothetical protein